MVLSDEEEMSKTRNSPCHLSEVCSGLATGQNHIDHTLLQSDNSHSFRDGGEKPETP